MTSSAAASVEAAAVVEARDPLAPRVHLCGDWQLRSSRPDPVRLLLDLEALGARRLSFECGELGTWDSGILTFLLTVQEGAARRSIQVDASGLPEGLRRLVALAQAVPEKEGARPALRRRSALRAIGNAVIALARGSLEITSFLGEVSLALLRLVRGRARFRPRDLWLSMQHCGAEALPIVTLISFIVGLILAFVGAVQLEQFGASIYVADLVVLAMAREMAALMTGVIMSGRTGAAFAAELGTMKVNEEIDALKTMGIPPLDFLVLPRMLALVVMLPLLAIYSNLVGILGGAFVATGMLGMSLPLYVHQTLSAADMVDFWTGLLKAGVFGVLIAVAGCLRGLQTGNSASAVGDAATSAVVTGIVAIVVADGIFAVVFNILGI